MSTEQNSQRQSFTIDEVKNNPKLYALLADSGEVHIMLHKEQGADTVFVYPQKVYSDEIISIYNEAVADYKEAKKNGYNREQAVEEMKAAQ